MAPRLPRRPAPPRPEAMAAQAGMLATAGARLPTPVEGPPGAPPLPGPAPGPGGGGLHGPLQAVEDAVAVKVDAHGAGTAHVGLRRGGSARAYVNREDDALGDD